MKSHEENITKGFPDTQTYTKKYNYLNTQNPDIVYIQSSRPKILQTISEQAFSEDKGSVSNRSESAQNTNRIRKNLSEQNINDNRSSFKNYRNQPICSMSHLVENFLYPNRTTRVQQLYLYDKKAPSTLRMNEVYSLSGYQCCQCTLYLNKIAELQTSYELLLLAKSQELQECKIIIKGLEEKLKQIEKRNLYQIEKNKKFRSQIQKRNTEDHYHRERENQIIQYLKNRQIILLEQMKDLQNKIYIKDIRTKNQSSANKSVESHQKHHSNSKGFNSATNLRQFNAKGRGKQNLIQFNEDHSISQCSAKTFDQQFYINLNVLNEQGQQFLSENGKQISANNQLYSSPGTKMAVQFIQRIPLNEILKKTNQISCLRDNLLVSELKIKIEQTKSLENLLFPK